MPEKREIPALTQGLTGRLEIPSDKSISHRAVMFASLAKGKTRIRHFLHAADCLSTVACMRALGASIEMTGTELLLTGKGLHGLHEATQVLNAGNSGTTLRLLLGILAAQPFFTTLQGDASLTKRPMARVLKPLSQMGAQIYGREDNHYLPLAVVPNTEGLHGITYQSPVASAQVKSAILLAGLYAEGETTVIEPARSRDHTERMLTAFGATIHREGKKVTLQGHGELYAPAEIIVPGDISSAAFWLVAASIIQGSDLLLENVGINETRTGILDVLKDMGAKIEILATRTSGGEEVADLHVCYTPLHGITFGGDIVPRLIDEVPALAVAALFAEGETRMEGAGELRVKETNRLEAIATEFAKLAPQAVRVEGDSLIIQGSRALQKATCSTYRDHRMAMALTIAGLAGQGVTLDDTACVGISYPTFYQDLQRLCS